MKNKSYISTVIANWKMHNDFNAALDLVIKIFSYSNMAKNVEKIICPPAVNIIPLYDQFKNSTFSLGAQNINENNEGTYTGEISVNMLKNYITHAIIGHSERREIFNDFPKVNSFFFIWNRLILLFLFTYSSIVSNVPSVLPESTNIISKF